MAYLNENYLKLQAGYLFPEIARRVREFCEAHPEAAKRLIRCGIGDVTEHSVILYGGMQEFDGTTSTLTVCLVLRNRDSQPMRAPIKLEAREITSSMGSVTITNATNGVAGDGAVWDISNSLTGDQIPAGASSNPFCLAFHLERSSADPTSAGPESLLKLRMQVLASQNGESETFDRFANSAARKPRQAAQEHEK